MEDNNTDVFEKAPVFKIDKEEKIDTFEKLIGKIFKILPYYETNECLDKPLIGMLIMELNGVLGVYINREEEEYNYKQVSGTIVKLKSLYDTDKGLINHAVVKKLVLNCTNSLSRVVKSIKNQ